MSRLIRVVVVEDERFMRREIVQLTPWSKFSCEVIGEASNGIEGESLIRELKPDLVITDIRMPGQDGIQMLQNIPPCASIILTGHSDFEYAREALRLGAKDYILKPIDDEIFYASLDKISKDLLSTKAQKNHLNQSKLLEGDKQDFYVNKAILFIEENYAKDISLKDAAAACGITDSYLARIFRAKKDTSFVEQLKIYRIKIALFLLEDRTLRINEVARRSGFRDMSYFSAVFKKETGLSPSQFINGEGEIPKEIYKKFI